MQRRQPWHRKQQFCEGQDALEYVLLVAGVLSFQFALVLLSYIAERHQNMPRRDPETGLMVRYFQEERPPVDPESQPRGPDLREQAAYLYDLLPAGFRNSAFALKLRRIADCGRRGNPCVRLGAGPFRLIEHGDLAEFSEWKDGCAAKANGRGEWRKARLSAASSTSSKRPKLECQGWRNVTSKS